MTDAPQTAPRRSISQAEFVAMMAVLFATIAFSIDSMLPALPEIAGELSPADPNRAQLVLTAFVFGMGAGTLVAGPLSDAIGRKTTITGAIGLYIAGSLMAIQATTLEMLLAARVLQGIGAAGPRIVSTAMMRDLFEGRAMARIMSFVMISPTMLAISPGSVAPFLGSGVASAPCSTMRSTWPLPNPNTAP